MSRATAAIEFEIRSIGGVSWALRNSITAMAIDDETGATIGLARVFTDRATFARLCDVAVVERSRDQGLWQRLIGALERHPALQTVRRWALATRDAEGLYGKLGYERLTASGDGWRNAARRGVGWTAFPVSIVRKRP